VLTGVFAVGAFTVTKDLPQGQQGLLEGNAGQVVTQLIGVGICLVWCAVATFVILKIVDVMVGLRVNLDHERMGLDITQHGESVHA
jgi:Amt family ammonium transporter